MRLLAFIVLLSLVGCSSTPDGTITIPRIPVWVAVPGEKALTGEEMRGKMATICPGVFIDYSDISYTVVSSLWLDRFTSWVWYAARDDAFTYTPESLDCDDFALGFYFFSHRAAARAGVRSAPMVGRATVVLSPTLYHMVNLVITEKGPFIVEPQPTVGAFPATPLSNYRYKIIHIDF